MKPYTPELVGKDEDVAYYKFIVELPICCGCEKPMMVLNTSGQGPFPIYNRISQKTQMENADIKTYSGFEIGDEEKYCDDCVKSNKTKFECTLCKKSKDSSKVKETFGCCPTEYLCIDCYESVTAKVWKETIIKLLSILVWECENHSL